jgi:hypothetical protein
MGIYIELPKDWAKYEIIVTDFHDNELEAKAIDLDLVRCGECKWWKPVVYSNGEIRRVCVQTPIEPATKPDDFCSYGERRG